MATMKTTSMNHRYVDGDDDELDTLWKSSCLTNPSVKMTLHRFLSLTAMAFLFTGSQIPVYLFGEFKVSSQAD